MVAVPTSVAYGPIYNLYWAIAAITMFLLAVSLILAYFFSKSLIDVILGLYEAARAVTNQQDYVRYLPLDREDEIGQVASCFDSMATRINQNRQKILEEKTGRNCTWI